MGKLFNQAMEELGVTCDIECLPSPEPGVFGVFPPDAQGNTDQILHAISVRLG